MLRAFLRRYWPVLVATAVLLPHAMLFDFVNDDAYISFRYARNLAEHGQLVFNLGERVEGFTNFLWTVLLAAGMKLGVSPVVASRFLGVGFGVGTLALVVRLSLRLDDERPSPWHAVAPLGLAATGAYACWCTGGLETQLFTFLSLLAWERLLAECASGRGQDSAAAFALASMTRPEGVLFFGLAGIFRVGRTIVRERRLLPRTHELAWVALFIAVFGPYFAWRWHYYGYPLPNTFYVKSSGGRGTYDLGIYYLRRFAEDYGVLFFGPLLLAGWGVVRDARRRDLFALSALVTGVFALYVIKVGGDFMGLYRFILPVLPLLAVCLQESLRALAGRLSALVPSPALVAAGLALAIGFGAGSWKVSALAASGDPPSDHGIDSPAYLKRYVDERVPVGLWLGQHAQPDDLASVGGAGVIPYYSRLRAFDTFGLVDKTIAHDPTMTNSNRPGHQKWVAPWYLFQRRPTLITHEYCLGTHQDCLSRCVRDPAYWRANGYEWVIAEIPPPAPAPEYCFLKRLDRNFGPFSASPP